MSDARGRAEWDRVYSLMVFVGSAFGPRPYQPVDLIPEQFRPPPPPEPTAAEKADKKRRNWRNLDTFMKQFGG